MDLETAITTQEQLDEVIKDRLAREAKKFEGYTSPKELEALKARYEKQIGDLNGALASAGEKAKSHDAEIAERDAKIRGYETDSVKTRIAHEEGLPYELHGRLSGETEEDIRKDAQSLAKLMKAQPAAPLASPEKPLSREDTKAAAYKQLLGGLKNE